MSGLVERKTPQLTYQTLVNRIKEECSCNDWYDGVLKYYEGTSQTGQLYPGPTNQAEPLMSAFEVFLNKLLDLSATNSTILSSSSTAILDGMSKLSNMGGSYGNLLKISASILPQLSDELKAVISNLSDNIGRSTTVLMNNAITDLVESILHFAFIFQKSGVEHFANGLAKNVDFQPIIKYSQVLLNVIALVAETTINDCSIATPKVLESLAVITLISNWYFIGAHSINVVVQAILHTASQNIPDTLHVSLLTIDSVLRPMADMIDVIDKALERDIVQALTRLVSCTISFNMKLDVILGPFDGVATSVGYITDTLLVQVNKAR